MSVIEKIKELAALIRGATQPAENDANRVGLTFEKIGDELEALDTKIDTETSNRTTAISNEAAARQAADTALQQADTTEKNARQDADATLQQAITDEADARQAADATLQQAITDEAAARQAADTALRQADTTEKNARQNADATLQQAITDEAAARQAADTALQQADTTEKNARQDADTALQQAIDAVRRSFYTAAGAVYNATTGYYELNGLTDITEEQMSEIYAIGIGWHPGMDSYARFSLQRIRTNILPTSKNNASGTGCVVSGNNNYVAVSALGMFDTCIQLEVACVGVSRNVEFGIFPKTALNMFQNCRVLRKIIGHIVMIRTDANQTTNMFRGCAKLREVNIRRLTQNLSFADSPLLYYTSLSYLVSNSVNTAAITVTVHADVYAKLTRTYEGSVISLIGDEAAETGQDVMTLAGYWNKLPAAAAEKNISFAES